MTTKTKSCHCPSEIIPTNYIYCFSYSGGGFMEPPIGLRAISKLRAEGKKFADPERGTFQCNSCGAHFRHGDCWLHVPTGEYVFFGQICSDKYGFLAERDEWQMEVKNTKARKAKLILEEIIREKQEKVLADNPALIEAFDNQAAFIQRIKEGFEHNGFITEKQIAAILQTHERSKTEIKIAALSGKREITGTILSCKPYENGFGGCTKMTVKVGDDSGFYIAWGTLPAKLESAMDDVYAKEQNIANDRWSPSPDLPFYKGFIVSFTATFTVSDKDESFCFFKRPSKVSLISTKKVEV